MIPPSIEHGVHCSPQTVIRSLYIAVDSLGLQHGQVLEIDPLFTGAFIIDSLVRQA